MEYYVKITKVINLEEAKQGIRSLTGWSKDIVDDMFSQFCEGEQSLDGPIPKPCKGDIFILIKAGQTEEYKEAAVSFTVEDCRMEIEISSVSFLVTGFLNLTK